MGLWIKKATVDEQALFECRGFLDRDSPNGKGGHSKEVEQKTAPFLKVLHAAIGKRERMLLVPIGCSRMSVPQRLA